MRGFRRGKVSFQCRNYGVAIQGVLLQVAFDDESLFAVESRDAPVPLANGSEFQLWFGRVDIGIFGVNGLSPLDVRFPVFYRVYER